MNILAIDYGHVRVGLAYADTSLGVAVPIPAAVEGSFEARIEHIAGEIKNRRIHNMTVKTVQSACFDVHCCNACNARKTFAH